MNDTCKERIGNQDYVTFGADTEIPYGSYLQILTVTNEMTAFLILVVLTPVLVNILVYILYTAKKGQTTFSITHGQVQAVTL